MAFNARAPGLSSLLFAALRCPSNQLVSGSQLGALTEASDGLSAT